MALSIGVRAGSKIQVGKVTLEVKQLVQPSGILIQVAAVTHLITDLERTEILPGVYVSDGTPAQPHRLSRGARLAFEAPRTVQITRLPE